MTKDDALALIARYQRPQEEVIEHLFLAIAMLEKVPSYVTPTTKAYVKGQREILLWLVGLPSAEVEGAMRVAKEKGASGPIDSGEAVALLDDLRRERPEVEADAA